MHHSLTWHHLAWKVFFWSSLTNTKQDQAPPSQVMSIVEFSPTALNFGYDFVLLVQFFGTLCIFVFFLTGGEIWLFYDMWLLDSVSADTAFDHLLEGLLATKHKVILHDLG